ncbi:MAG TPA: TIGR01777 family oxidoreductase [Ignavibacteria bacterium]|nr:TIGR01777 family oxidoreductase [Ignavibacteria bacterium]
MPKTVLIAGGTGQIGSHLIPKLLSNDYSVKLLTRDVQKAKNLLRGTGIDFIQWNDNSSIDELSNHINVSDYVINLAGANVAGKRWSNKFKQLLYDSRINSTRKLVDAIRMSGKKPEAFICASGVGIYGFRSDTELNEESTYGKDFLAKLCIDWEAEAKKAEEFGVRVVNMRTGFVLDKNEGAFPKLSLPFKLFVGGYMGNGKQYISWIHINDVIELYMFALDDYFISEPLNLTAPNPVTNKQFCKAMGKALHRPCWAPIPGFALKIISGELSESLLHGQRVIPQKALDHHFKFEFTEIDTALKDLVKK